jgi:hypothetical protein
VTAQGGVPVGQVYDLTRRDRCLQSPTCVGAAGIEPAPSCRTTRIPRNHCPGERIERDDLRSEAAIHRALHRTFLCGPTSCGCQPTTGLDLRPVRCCRSVMVRSRCWVRTGGGGSRAGTPGRVGRVWARRPGGRSARGRSWSCGGPGPERAGSIRPDVPAVGGGQDAMMAAAVRFPRSGAWQDPVDCCPIFYCCAGRGREMIRMSQTSPGDATRHAARTVYSNRCRRRARARGGTRGGSRAGTRSGGTAFRRRSRRAGPVAAGGPRPSSLATYGTRRERTDHYRLLDRIGRGDAQPDSSSPHRSSTTPT